MNPFEQYLEELSSHLGIPLQAEKGYICKLAIDGTLRVHLEHEPEQNRILIAAFLGEIPPGKFREDLLKEGLKANHLPNRQGTFAYSGKNNNLVYFSYFFESEPSSLLGEKLSQFIATAKTWKKALETGQLHLIASSSSPSFPSLFRR